jgi:anionic cell wall polymer biosynthesis LytR-Cps2A-Psr (LCP) family protein
VSGKHSRPRDAKVLIPPAEVQSAPTEVRLPSQQPAREQLAAVATIAPPEPAAPAVLPVVWDARSGDLHALVSNRRSKRGRLVAAGAIVALVAAGGVAFATRHSNKPAPVAPVATGDPQTTLLIQLSGSLGTAVDSALVAHDSAHHQGVVVLVPSEVVAQVPGFGAMPFGQALTVGDPQAPQSTLSDLIGATVEGSWVLSPVAMESLVDRLGGITVTVDRDVTSTTAAGVTTIVVPAGTQKLNGSAAVAYATFLADSEPEQSRLARFDAVLGAVLAALPTSNDQVASMLGGLGTGSVSSFPAARLAGVLTGLAADNAAHNTTDQVLPVTVLDTGDSEQAFSVDAAKTKQLVGSYLADSIPSNLKITGNRVLVENQVGSPGIGESTRTKLAAANFVYEPGPNAPGMPNATLPSVVLIFSTTAADIARGDAVATALGLPTSDVKVSSQELTVADVIAIIGADYKR